MDNDTYTQSMDNDTYTVSNLSPVTAHVDISVTKTMDTIYIGIGDISDNMGADTQAYSM